MSSHRKLKKYKDRFHTDLYKQATTRHMKSKGILIKPAYPNIKIFGCCNDDFEGCTEK